MVRKKYFRKLYGKKLDIWDFILFVIVVGFPVYIWITQGWTTLLEDFGWSVYSAVITAFVITFLIRKARK